MDLANPGFMNSAAQLTDIAPAVQQALLGQQQIQGNQNTLDAQARAEQARQATAIVTDPNAPPEQRQAAMQHLQTVDPASAYALRRLQQMQTDWAQVVANPDNPQLAARFTVAYPEVHEQVGAGLKIMSQAQQDALISTAADVKGYLTGGHPDLAIQALQAHMDADKAAGLDVSQYPALMNYVRQDPKGALAHTNILLATAMGPEKFADAYKTIGESGRADELQPYQVQQQAVAAQYAAPKAQSELDTAASQRAVNAQTIANGIVDSKVKQGQLALDTNKLAADTNVAMAKIEAEAGKLTPGSEKIVNDAAGQAAATQQIADREKALAASIRASGMHAFGSYTEALKSLWGGQDQYTQMRAEWAQLKNQGMLANAKGVFNRITNADLKLLQEGFPDPDSSPKYIANFLDTMARAHEAIAQQNDDKASWAARNGSLGPAAKPMVIDGMRVPAGMTFMQHQKLRTQIAAPPLPADAQAVVQRAAGQ